MYVRSAKELLTAGQRESHNTFQDQQDCLSRLAESRGSTIDQELIYTYIYIYDM